jgi:hypothetical protein
MGNKLGNKVHRVKPSNAKVADNSRAIGPTVEAQDGKSNERLIAESSLSSIMTNTGTSRTFAAATLGAIDLTESVAVMCEKVEKVFAGDLTEAEATLMAQAVTLDTIFNELARRAALNMGEYINATDTFMRLALKAQSQCRATLETLAEIKNPRHVAFVKQANIAHGLQQVNNGTMNGGPLAHEGISSIQSNEQLGVSDGERLDTGAQSAASAANQELVPVGKIDRATNGARQRR